MPVYEYQALDRAGKSQNGIIDADSPMAARQKLRRSGVFPVALKETSSTPKEKTSGRSSVATFFKRVKPGEIAAVTRQLAILLGAGITLVAALDALISQVPNPLLKQILAQTKESVNEGNSLAFSLAQHPKVFSEIYVNMVKAGEASGSLDLVLHRLAELTERQQALRGRLRAALAYPLFMLFVGVLVLFFLIAFIVPNITKIFDEMHQILPLPTLILIRTSNFLKSFWWVVVGGCGCALFLLRRFVLTSRGRRIWDRIKLGAPLVGSLNTRSAMARFSRTLGSLLQNGVPLITALGIVKNIVNNIWISEAVDQSIDDIQSGKGLAASLSKSRWFPPIAIQMISAGEQSGEIEAMLNKIADVFEGEVESQTLAMTSMLEPIMILGMGVTVGFIVISILLPIFEMNQMVR
jgi:general secretion pathway protein F